MACLLYENRPDILTVSKKCACLCGGSRRQARSLKAPLILNIVLKREFTVQLISPLTASTDE
jgi:hypothetical protein